MPSLRACTLGPLRYARRMSEPRTGPSGFSVVVVDDHPVLRLGIKSSLAKSPRLRVVAEAADGSEALTTIREHQPDVVVLDLFLPHLNGQGVIAAISKELPRVRFVAYSLREEPWFISAVLAAGARAYVSKRSNESELVRAVEQVAADVTPVKSASRLGQAESWTRRGDPRDRTLAGLSPRELETLRLVARGTTAKEAAQQLSVGVRTLETYKARAMQKLQLRSRADLVSFAEHSGWLTDADEGWEGASSSHGRDALVGKDPRQ